MGVAVNHADSNETNHDINSQVASRLDAFDHATITVSSYQHNHDNHHTESMTKAGERAEILNIIRDGCEVLIRE